jgi:hypothetical protein
MEPEKFPAVIFLFRAIYNGAAHYRDLAGIFAYMGIRSDKIHRHVENKGYFIAI